MGQRNQNETEYFEKNENEKKIFKKISGLLLN